MGSRGRVVEWSRKWGRGVELLGGKNGLSATVASFKRGEDKKKKDYNTSSMKRRETPPPKQPIDKAYSITSIKACIPTPLDLDKLNYNSWSLLFQQFCKTYEDYQTRRLLLRCDSTGDLYPVTQQPSSTTTFALLSLSPTTWHRRLRHPSEDVLRRLESSHFISCNKTKLSALRHALVPRPANVNIVRSMWLFKHKFNEDGSLSRYKALLVANGRNQQQGIDCDETFIPVVKLATIRTVLSLAVRRDWPIHQLDVKIAFLHGQLSETVYVHQPPGFVDSAHPNYVFHLQRSLYGLKQALRAWFYRFANFITLVSFQHSKTDTSIFFYHRGLDVAYLLLYMDDIVLTASSTALLQHIITLLHSEFTMTDISSLIYFLGVSVQQSKFGLFLSRSKFVVKFLKRAHMQHCNPCKTPVDTESKLGFDGDLVSDPTLYRSLAGILQCILRYVCGTINHGLQLYVLSTSQLTASTDVNWAAYPVTRSQFQQQQQPKQATASQPLSDQQSFHLVDETKDENEKEPIPTPTSMKTSRAPRLKLKAVKNKEKETQVKVNKRARIVEPRRRVDFGEKFHSNFRGSKNGL
nr:ribonuclease H-like domain-containing protein [Tanacetum cinerariifolium]GEY09714.1 ribonuclease H-like domain-containing protein [Tanacetum cinerariifolium]